MVHDNSLEAYYNLDKLNKRKQEVIMTIMRLGNRATDRQVAEALGSADPNRSRPSITELIKMGIVREVGIDRTVESYPVRIVSLVDNYERVPRRLSPKQIRRKSAMWRNESGDMHICIGAAAGDRERTTVEGFDFWGSKTGSIEVRMLMKSA